MAVYKTTSAVQTKKLAGFLAEEILKNKNFGKEALVLALSGDLGAGKTVFSQGFLRGLGVKRRLISPTFVIMKKYKLKNRYYDSAYHIDCYRIKKPKEFSDLKLDVFKNSRSVVLIEWPERIKKILPENSIWIKLKHGGKENIRFVYFFAGFAVPRFRTKILKD